MTRQATYEDYLWTENGGTAGEFESFCLAFIEDATVGEVIAHLPVIEELGSMNFPDELRFISYDDWNEQRLLVGLFEIDSWTVLFEVNGFVGITPQIILPLSRGRRVISHHYSDGNCSETFNMYQDGRLTASVDPRIGIADLWANDPDMSATLTTIMRECGFGSTSSTDDSPQAGSHNRAATFALMERLTGVRLEPQTVAEATFTVVRVRVPH